MKKITQEQLIIAYIKQHDSLIPAKMANKSVEMWIDKQFNHWFGSELPRKCRLLRERGILESKSEGKYEKFYIKSQQGLGLDK